MKPSPPASLTARASSTVDGPPAIGACTTGCSSDSSTPTTGDTRQELPLCGRPVRARVGQRRELRLDLLAVGLELRRQDHLRAELLERHVDREAGAVVGDLEQDPGRLAEVDRVEVVAVDDAGGLDAGLRQPLLPA